MNRIIRHIILLFILFSGIGLKGQQLPIFSQYVLNGFILNPAIAGYDGYTSVNTTARQQWLGIKGAPQTFAASWQTRLMQRSYKIVKNPVRSNNMVLPSTKGRVGLGAYIINDVNGDVAKTGIQFTYGYHIIMGHSQLSFGLAGKLFQYRINDRNLTFGSDDPLLTSGINETGYRPDIDFGVYFTNATYFIGASVNNIIQSPFNIGGGSLDYKIERHYWIMGGYRFALTRDLAFEPNALLKTTEKWIPQADIGAKLYFMENYWVGLAFRTDKSLITLFGMTYNTFFVGYAFDYSFSALQGFNYGTHEVSLSYKFGDDARRYRWLRRY